HHGAAVALMTYNLGVRVKGIHIRRGDFMQMNWTDWTTAQDKQAAKDDGHAVICYHTRKIPGGETRFLILSSQKHPNGVGFYPSRRAISGLEGAAQQLLTHPPKDLESPAYIKALLTYGQWFICLASDDAEAGAGSGPELKRDHGGYYRCQV